MLEQARSTVGHRSPHQQSFHGRNPVKLLTSWGKAGARTEPTLVPQLWNYICSFAPKPGSQTGPSWSWKRNTAPRPAFSSQDMTKQKAVCALSSPIPRQGSKHLDDTFTAACAALCLPMYHLHRSSSANWDQLLQFQILLSRNIDTTTLWLESTLPNASQFCTAQWRAAAERRDSSLNIQNKTLQKHWRNEGYKKQVKTE